MKHKASSETVAAFCKAVYPEMTELCMTTNGEEEILKEATRLIQEVQARADRLAQALKDLIYTTSKLWDEVKPIKDGPALTVTHPIIEKAHAALAAEEQHNGT